MRGINRRQDFPITGALLTRLLRRISRPAVGCWEWDAEPKRYPQVSFRRQNISAHRAMYRHVYGHEPAGMVICHKCDNKRCLRPSHLEAAPQAKNIQDAWDRGLQTARS